MREIGDSDFIFASKTQKKWKNKTSPKAEPSKLWLAKITCKN